MTMSKKKKLEPLAYSLAKDAVWEPMPASQVGEGVQPLANLAYSHRAVFDAKALIPQKPEDTP